MRDERRNIRFIDSDYNTLFNIKDGESIKITRGYDGEEVISKCRFLDEAHLHVGINTYHICEFAERMEKAGNKYEPVPNQPRRLDILYTKYGESLQSFEVPISKAAIEKLVGGKRIMALPYENGVIAAMLVSGSEGIAICGTNNDTLTSLHPY